MNDQLTITKRELQEGEVFIISNDIIKLLEGFSSSQAAGILKTCINQLQFSTVVIAEQPVQSSVLPIGKSDLQGQSN